MLIRMITPLIMTPITRKHFLTTTKSKPAIAFTIMRTATTTREFLTSDDAEGFFGLFANWGKRGARCGADEEEFYFGDFEG